VKASKASIAFVLFGMTQVGCGDGATTPEPKLVQVNEDLTGPYTVNTSCSAAAQDYLQRSMRLGRIASASKGFQQCIKNLAVGTPNAAAPYYPKCNPSDPDVKSGISVQVTDLLKYTQIANPLTINCDANFSGGNAYASIGSLKTTSESITFGNWLNSVVGQVGSQPDDPNWPLSQIAGTVWHEVMHNYGYNHPDKCSDPTYGPLYYYQSNTIPYIVDGCMSVAVSANGNACANVTCPPDSAAMLTDLTSSTCECVADPGTMNMETAFLGKNGNLWEDGPAWSGDTGGKIVPGSSPSIAALSDDSYIVAFEGYPSNFLWLSGTKNRWSQNTQLGMMQNTSPSVTGLFGGYPTGSYEAAFQANTGVLWVTGTAGTGPTGYPMAAGTSPSIAGAADGNFEVAFQASKASDGQYYLSTWTRGNLWYGMKASTSPSIATAASGGYYIAFQANTGELWVIGLGPSAPGPTGKKMQAGTSPSITGLSGGGYEVAYQDTTSALSVYGTSRTATASGALMRSGTSPSIAPLPKNGFEAVYQDTSGYLTYYGTSKNGKSTAQLVNTSTPGIAGLLVLP
jgi:hypothetical protein